MVDMSVILLVVVVVVVVLVHFLKFHKDWSRGWQVIPSFAKCHFVNLLICQSVNFAILELHAQLKNAA